MTVEPKDFDLGGSLISRPAGCMESGHQPVTSLQPEVLLFLRRHADAKLTDAATALRTRQPILREVVNALVRKWWVTKRRSVTDTRAV